MTRPMGVENATKRVKALDARAILDELFRGEFVWHYAYPSERERIRQKVLRVARRRGLVVSTKAHGSHGTFRARVVQSPLPVAES